MTNVLGIDPSSSCTGLAIRSADGGLLAYGYWEPSKKVKKLAAKQKDKSSGDDVPRLNEYFSFLNTWIRMRKSLIDEVVVEELGMTRGANVARVLSHFQAVSSLAAYRAGFPVTKIKAGVARNAVLGCKITIGKPEALALLRETYTNIDWPTGKGADDIGDAYMLAAARALARS
jgi:Holliday junction resolvasome RuvABC endonuclease subunit